MGDGSEYTGNYAKDMKDCKFLKEFHQERASVLLQEEPDVLLFETIPSMLEIHAITEALQAIASCNSKMPSIIVSMCCTSNYALSSGEPLAACVQHLAKCPVVHGIGINCTKPVFVPSLLNVIQQYKHEQQLIVCYPNSGETWRSSDNTWHSEPDDIVQSPDYFAQIAVEQYCKAYGAQIIGGCCRIGVPMIHALSLRMRATIK